MEVVDTNSWDPPNFVDASPVSSFVESVYKILIDKNRRSQEKILRFQWSLRIFFVSSHHYLTPIEQIDALLRRFLLQLAAIQVVPLFTIHS